MSRFPGMQKFRTMFNKLASLALSQSDADTGQISLAPLEVLVAVVGCEHRACRKETRRYYTATILVIVGTVDIFALSQQLLISSPGESPKQPSLGLTRGLTPTLFGKGHLSLGEQKRQKLA